MGRNDDNGAGYNLMMEIFDDQPGGQTPICAQINEVVAKIQAIEDQLRSNNQRAAVIICTDGQSTYIRIIRIMRIMRIIRYH